MKSDNSRPPESQTAQILATLQRYWGFSSLRPLQERAIHAGLERRDSLVVLPTGGGKSICYQIPAELSGGTDIVVSPLIALMKDQVDGLRQCGYPAAALHSGLSPNEVREMEGAMLDRRFRLVFVAPERLLMPRFLNLLDSLGIRAFAIDEAHCISHWGHDFRPEYRQLSLLKKRFATASVHAFTATATQRVRTDIVEQLGLDDPSILVGTFDRPNLVYRVVPRLDVRRQVLEVVRRHRDQAVIVYCISRKDAESMAASLVAGGVRAAYYHAGMEPEQRRATQDDFAAEKIDVVAATVAFGMGIDRSDVRCVVHAAMPKSVEHFQQETGRAGRDGLEAECVLFYSASDAIRWEQLMERGNDGSKIDVDVQKAQRELLGHMRRYCQNVQCRHRMLSAYFGQDLENQSCGACDACLGEVAGVADATVTAQKVLSCVARTGELFGVEHIIDVLLGADTERVHRWSHDRVSTYGLLKGTPRKALTNILYQLLDGGLLERSAGDRPSLRLNAESWAVMRGQRSVQLLQPVTKVKTAAIDDESWAGVDRDLFEALRTLRRQIADERGVPAFVVFADTTLREMARQKPTSLQALLAVRGVGQRKLTDLGERFLAAIAEHCQRSAEATR